MLMPRRCNGDGGNSHHPHRRRAAIQGNNDGRRHGINNDGTIRRPAHLLSMRPRTNLAPFQPVERRLLFVSDNEGCKKRTACGGQCGPAHTASSPEHQRDGLKSLACILFLSIYVGIWKG